MGTDQSQRDTRATPATDQLLPGHDDPDAGNRESEDSGTVEPTPLATDEPSATATAEQG